METAPVTIAVDVHTTAGRDEAWRVFSDSDALNRVMGLGFKWEEVVQPDGTVRRFGNATSFGVERRWEEVGLWFERPTRVVNRRVFDAGPMALVETEVTFRDGEAGGTIVHYENRFTPRTEADRPGLEAYVGGALRPAIERVLGFAQMVAEGRGTLEPAPTPIGDEVALQATAEKVEPVVVGREIARIIGHASIREQARIRPLAVAARMGLDPDVVVKAFVDAVQLGLLAMEFASLCPACHGAKSVSTTVGDAGKSATCTSCNVEYDASSPERLEVVFRTSPRWRLVSVAVDCLLSPSRTPHVLARTSVASRERKAVHFEATEAGAIIEVSPRLTSAVIEVRPGSTVHSVTFDVGPGGVRPRYAEVAPGPVEVFLTGRGRDAVEVAVKVRDLPPYTLTAGRMLQIPGVEERLPPGSIAAGAVVRVEPGIVVWFTGVLAPDAIPSQGRRMARATDAGLITVWRRPEDALAAMESVAGEEGVSIGVAAGPVVAVHGPSGALPGGAVVDRAAALARAGGNGHVVVDERAEGALLGFLEGLGERGKLWPPSSGARRLDLAVAADRLRARVEALRVAAEARTASEPQRMFGGCFRIVREIARGGMGAIFEVFDEETEQRLVLKTLLPELVADAKAVQRFYHEARMSIALDHPNVVHVSDYGQDDDTHELFIVMEFLAGQELRNVLDARGSLEPDEVRAVGVGILRGLGHAHESGIVHRDLKPENVFITGPLTDSASVRLIDFGIAHPMDAECDLAQQGIIVGTPMYLSPEQVDAKVLDARSDLYAAGLILWEAAAGKQPYAGRNAYEIVMGRMQRTVPDLRTLRANTPGGLAQAIVIATRIDRDERYVDAEAMEQALTSAS